MPASATSSSPDRRHRSTVADVPIGHWTAKHVRRSARNSATTASTWSPPTSAASAAREAAHEILGQYGIVPHRRAQGRPRHPATAYQPGAPDPGGHPTALAARQPLALAAQAFAVADAGTLG